MPKLDNPAVKRKKRGLACKTCRKRKVKCNITDKFPCSSCTSLNIECIESTIDKRKERIESDYTRQLETRLNMYQEENARIASQLENIVTVMKELSDVSKVFDSERSHNEISMASLNNNTEKYKLGEKTPVQDELNNENVNLNEKYPTPATFKAFDNKPLSVYGPTSVFDNNFVLKLNGAKEMEEIYTLNRDSDINEYIKLFFQWQYPDIHIFVFREAFLLDFLHAKKNSSYCSVELIFSVCAFGSLLSDAPNKKELSYNFYEQARELCFRNYAKPSISLLQSFLLLGLYDIYNGKNDSGWTLTGMGMRMGYSIGLQLNSRDIVGENKPELGTKIKSRIFWGTYLTDHLIGLLLGRPPSLKRNDSTIEETIELPDIDWINEYTCPGFLKDGDEILLIGKPLCEVVKLMEISGNMINDIFDDQKYNKQNINLQLYEKLPLVKQYNLKIFEWRRQLPKLLIWDSLDLENIGSDPTTLTFKLIYYIVILCLNRPFLNLGANENILQYRENCCKICLNAVNDLTIALRKFIQVYGFSKCSNLVIYSSIISISVILRSHRNNITDALFEDSIIKYKVLTFMKILKECSKLWGLSAKAFELTKGKLQKEHQIDIENDLEDFDILQNINLLDGSQMTDEFVVKDHDLLLEDINGMGKNYDSLENDTSERKDSLGGPPVFMQSNTFTFLDELFLDDNIDQFSYEI